MRTEPTRMVGSSSLRMWPAALALLFAVAVLSSACADCKNSSDCPIGQVCSSGECGTPDADTDSDVDTDTDADTDTDNDTDTDSDTDSDTDTDTDTDIECTLPEECDDENECTDDDCIEFTCVNAPLDMIACTFDTNECTEDLCLTGVCTGIALGPTHSCTEDGNPCTDDVCVDGVCSGEPDNEGDPCPSDGNECTEDVCHDGECGEPVITGTPCTYDSSPCTQDYCNSSGTCVATDLEDGTDCDDGLWCNGTEECLDGDCAAVAGTAPCELTNPCKVGTCVEPTVPGNPGTCGETNLTGPSCDSGLYCDGVQECVDGACTTTEIACEGTSAGECEIVSCSETTPHCGVDPQLDGVSCADADLCDGQETCQDGFCAGESPICPSADCATQACEQTGGSTECTTWTYADDGTPCDTTDVCDGSATHLCLEGACTDAETSYCAEDRDGDFCTYWMTCNEGDCLFLQSLARPHISGSLTCAPDEEGEAISLGFDTSGTTNEVTTYSAACPGTFSGGESLFAVEIDSSGSETVAITTSASTTGDDMWILSLTEGCENAGSSCLGASTTSLVVDEIGTTGYGFVVVDGENGTRGTGVVTITSCD